MLNEERKRILKLVDNLICEWDQEDKGQWFVKQFIKDLKHLKKEIKI